MDEGTLGVHKIELMIDTGEDFGDSGGVGDHADSTHDLGQITTRDDGRRLVVDTALETGRGPVDELDGTWKGVEWIDVESDHYSSGTLTLVIHA